MSKEMRILILALLLTTISGISHAVTRQWCAKWYVRFIDSNYYEDYWADASSWVQKPAAYSRAVLYNENTGGSEAKFLDSNGCADFTTATNTNYTFRTSSWLERVTGRVVKVAYSGYDCGSGNYFWRFTSHPIGNTLPSSPIIVQTTTSSPQIRATGMASWALSQANTRGYPDNVTTYMKVGNFGADTTGYIPGSSCIRVNTNYRFAPGDTWVMDHSQFKFVMGHEFGHRIEEAVVGRNYFSYGMNLVESDYCDCDNYDAPQDHCYQSWEHTGIAVKEGWAYFYGTAIFNSRASNCYMGLPRPYWQKSGSTYSWRNEYPPSTESGISCAAMPKWRVNECNDSADSKGIEQDWIGFFWNLWTSSEDIRYESGDITEILALTDPEDPYTTGWTWDELDDTAYDIWYEERDNQAKYDNFWIKGANAGVDY